MDPLQNKFSELYRRAFREADDLPDDRLRILVDFVDWEDAEAQGMTYLERGVEFSSEEEMPTIEAGVRRLVTDLWMQIGYRLLAAGVLDMQGNVLKPAVLKITEPRTSIEQRYDMCRFTAACWFDVVEDAVEEVGADAADVLPEER